MPYKPFAGLGHAPSYQVSGRPYLTGSSLDTNNPNGGEVHITFPSVTKSFTVINNNSSGHTIWVHFASRANANVETYHHYLELRNQDASFSFDVKCTDVYISMSGSGGTGSFELSAELTGIPASEMYALTGAGIDGYPQSSSF